MPIRILLCTPNSTHNRTIESTVIDMLTNRNRKKKQWEQAEAVKMQHRIKHALQQSISMMSDSKWRKALNAIAEHTPRATPSTWKLAWSPEVISENQRPEKTDILDRHLADAQFYYVDYQSIIWLRLTLESPNTIAESLRQIAQFDIETEESSLTIFGYRNVPNIQYR
ncbi:MAG: hypothetical protein AAGB26_16215 [Planctomycetota bacterium]